ncbi:MAG: lasso peptide biosynthesis B2 protein [Deltaproteobacteria bacterium]|nr:lasso peptide biosynthesis B2 protein [Deltaproteobacteria bacterium]
MTTPRAVVRAGVIGLRLPAGDRRAAMAALVALALVARALRRGGLAGAERRLARLPRLLPKQCQVTPRRLATLVSAVAKHVRGAECLAQSLVLARLVREAHPHDTVVRIGVRPGEGSLSAHAWVELGGVVLNDTDDVANRFPVIETRPPP